MCWPLPAWHVAREPESEGAGAVGKQVPREQQWSECGPLSAGQRPKAGVDSAGTHSHDLEK